MLYTCETRQLSGEPAPNGAGRDMIERRCRLKLLLYPALEEALVSSSGGRIGGSRGGRRRETCAPAPLCGPPARTPAASSGGYGRGNGLLFPFQQLKPQNKDIDHTYFANIMAANNTSRCVRFGDGTPPLCHANNLPQGQLCQQCVLPVSFPVDLLLWQ